MSDRPLVVTVNQAMLLTSLSRSSINDAETSDFRLQRFNLILKFRDVASRVNRQLLTLELL